jgi:hypothetical protein
MPFNWTPEARDRLQQLRAEGLSMVKCAKAIGCSDGEIFRALHPKPKPEPKPIPDQKPRPAALLPRTLHHGSVPIRKLNPVLDHEVPPLTYQDFIQAWYNTVRLSH